MTRPVHLLSVAAMVGVAAGALPRTGVAQATPPKPGTPAPAAATPTSVLPKIPFTTYVLANGLTIVLSVDHSAPVVAVDVEHHVGSKNEEVGRTGFAHLFEHVMFTGSGHIPYGVHDKYTGGIGGSNNGSTNNDKTNFYESVPSNYLETELWLESDRMGWLLDALDINKLNAQRDVVKNERRQRTDNVPFGRVGEIMDSYMFPQGHPYHWPVIGSMEDLTAASEADVKAFYNTWYGPNNAILVIAGDFDPVQAKAWVLKYFGDIPRGPAVTRPVVPPAKLDAPMRLVYEDNVSLPQLYVNWPGVGLRSADRAALTVMGTIVSGDRTQWLAQEFVYNRKWASSISLRPGMNENAGDVELTVVPSPGVDLTALESAIDSVLDRFKRDGPTAEQMNKATAGLEFAQYNNQLQSMLGKAQILASNWIYHGDPGWYATDIQETLAVTSASVKRVANTYLGPNRIVLSAVPNGKRDLASHAAQSTPVTSPFASKEVGK